MESRMLFIAVTGCTIGTIGIAASDGPLRYADAFAAAFFVTCEHTAYVAQQACHAAQNH